MNDFNPNHLFKIVFHFGDKLYIATVHKISRTDVKVIVSGVRPTLTYLPEKLVYVSYPESDELICLSFDRKHKELIMMIGQSIFSTCYEQKIAIHS